MKIPNLFSLDKVYGFFMFSFFFFGKLAFAKQ